MPSQKSVVLVGMRGAGKTSLGEAAAKALGWQFVDLDRWYEAKSGRTIASLVEAEGWPAFRREELNTLQTVLGECPERTVIACGGGIVETPAALAVLEAWTPVVHIRKPIEDVERLLAADTKRAKIAEAPRDIFARRESLYARAADFEFSLRSGEDDWALVERDMISLMRRVLRLAAEPQFGVDSFFLSLTFGDVQDAVPLLPAISSGVHALELRVDLLASQSPSYVRDQLAVLRRASDLPVVFTLRSRPQGGGFDGSPAEAAELLQLGLVAACEFVDVEAALPADVVEGLGVRRGVSRLIGSHHDMARMPPLEECGAWLRRCALGGLADMAKLVVGAERPEDCVSLQHTASALGLAVPVIAINAGEVGKMSRVLNRVFTPVTHPLLPFKAAPGQMSALEIMDIRRSTGYSRLVSA